ncbi:MAG: hypothetical protein ACOZNI_24835 [Myxococcota bacterium]
MIALFVASHLVATPAGAFSPGVHRALSERAVELEAEARLDARAFGRATAMEDWNLARKWLVWSHYYRPDFPTRRRPSDERVASLLARIRDADGAIDVLLGHAAHHVQDMASPPHVVPVQHGLGDDFESSDMRALLGEVRGDGVAAMDPAAAQRALATETAELVATGSLCGVPLADVWTSREGRFGEVGVPFGELCDRDAFVRDRLDRALAYTRAVVRWSAGE